MRACSDMQERILLKIYGELGTDEGNHVDAHLRECAGCRAEQARMSRVLARLREKEGHQRLSRHESAAMIAGLRRRLGPRAAPPWIQWLIPDFFIQRFPATAAAAAIVAIIAVFGAYQWFTGGGGSPVSNIDISRQLPEDEIEIIENLELLKEFNMLEKLNRVVDYPTEPNLPETETRGDQEVRKNEKSAAYA